MTQVPGCTSPGAIASVTSAGTGGEDGIQPKMVFMMLSFVVWEIAPTRS
jgi:hypothetical protein